MPQLVGKVVEASEDGSCIRLQNLENVEWVLDEQDWGRVEPEDVVCIDVPALPYPFVPGLTQITDEIRSDFRLVRVSKRGNPAFQG